ncbi:MAG TPA: DinB family protein [Thermoanaerobaculia bacterium]|nr:DinB family protein [Thermoanaerobaculia bacterium]
MHETLELLGAFPARLDEITAGLSETELRQPEKEGKWSVHDVVAHLADLELVYAVRIRTILSGAAGDAPLPALAQDAWVQNVHRREPLGELLEQFVFDRARNLALVRRLTDAELARTGRHPQYGEITIPMALDRLKNHDAKHFAQIERIRRSI